MRRQNNIINETVRRPDCGIRCPCSSYWRVSPAEWSAGSTDGRRRISGVAAKTANQRSLYAQTDWPTQSLSFSDPVPAIQWRRYESESGGTRPAKGPENFRCCAPPLCLALQVQLVVLVSAFVMVSTVWSVTYLLYFYSRCHPCPIESAPLKPATCERNQIQSNLYNFDPIQLIIHMYRGLICAGILKT